MYRVAAGLGCASIDVLKNGASDFTVQVGVFVACFFGSLIRPGAMKNNTFCQRRPKGEGKFYSGCRWEPLGEHALERS